jgi:hypothetical protein
LLMVWSTIQSVFGVGLGLGNPNSLHSASIMMLTLDPPSNRTSLTIVFAHLDLYHNHVWINHHQSNNWIGSHCSVIFSPRSKFGSNILFQI